MYYIFICNLLSIFLYILLYIVCYIFLLYFPLYFPFIFSFICSFTFAFLYFSLHFPLYFPYLYFRWWTTKSSIRSNIYIHVITANGGHIVFSYLYFFLPIFFFLIIFLSIFFWIFRFSDFHICHHGQIYRCWCRWKDDGQERWLS